jgi:hypothetical protein
MAIWLIAIAVALAVWWVERECSIKATQAIVKSVFLGLRLAFEAIILIELMNTTFFCLLGIAISISIAVILVLDALRVRVKLNDLDAARLPPSPEI